jgi:carbonic anhydrase
MKELIKGVQKFQTSYFNTHRELFEELSKGQKPRILFITCCDSRISPNLLTQTEPGELFIMRNMGNIIPPYGAILGGESAVIEYAIEVLKIKDIVVCGHSQCGAVQGLLDNHLSDNLPLVKDWLKYAESTRRIMLENYQHLSGEELVNTAIEENVLAQIENLKTYPSVHAKLYRGQLTIHAWIYRIETGVVNVYSTDRCNINAEHEEHNLVEYSSLNERK